MYAHQLESGPEPEEKETDILEFNNAALTKVAKSEVTCPPKFTVQGRTKPDIFQKDPTDFELSESGQLLQNFQSYEDQGEQQIAIFDRWLRVIAPINVAARMLRLADGSVVMFENLRILPPLYTRDGVVYPLTPQYAREQEITYGCDFYADIVHKDSVNGNYKPDSEVGKQVFLGTIPIPLRSCLCVLRGKSPQELLLLGEDPNDPLGIFIVGGVEKAVLGQEQMSLGKIFLVGKDRISTRITTNTQRGTVLTEIAYDPASNLIEMKFPSMKVKVQSSDEDKKKIIVQSLNVLRVFRLNGVTDVNDIKKLLGRFIPEEQRRACMLKLTASEMDFQAFPDDVAEVLRKLNQSNMEPNAARAEVSRIISTDFFPHLNDLKVEDRYNQAQTEAQIRLAKLNLLAAMTARILQRLCGYIPLDDRDSWSNKRVEGFGRSMERLFRDAWRKTLMQVQGAIEKAKENNSRLEFPAVVKKIQGSPVITNTFHDSFITAKWGVKGNQIKENISQTLQRDSVVAAFSHLSTIDVNISRTDRKSEFREVQNSQFGNVSPIDSPEGDNCGLVKNTAELARPSIETSDVEIIGLLVNPPRKLAYFPEDDIPDVTLSDGQTFRWPDGVPDVIQVNGKIIGWGNGPAIRLFLLELRRRNDTVPPDMGLIYENGWLYVDISPSRLVYPLLIVDPEVTDAQGNISQALAIDSIGRDKSNHELLSSGAIEYMSSWEQEYAKVAVSVDRITARSTSINQARQEYLAAVQALDTLNEQMSRIRVNEAGYARLQQQLTLTQQNVTAAQDKYAKLRATQPYTHCLLDPQTILSLASNTIPWPQHNQAPRNTYQASMEKQALGIYHVNHLNRYDGKTKILTNPQRPLVDTEVSEVMGLRNRGQGSNMIISFQALPDNEEDAFVFKQEFIERGGMRIQTYFTYKTEVRKTHNTITETLQRPDVGLGERANRYQHIQPNGLPRLGAYLNQGDCVIGKLQNENGVVRNASVFLKIGDYGIVEKVSVITNTRSVVAVVKLRMLRILQRGDKLSARNAQKGTIGRTEPEAYMEYSEEGLSPDCVAGPHCIPSRMTESYPLEGQAAKAAAYMGKRVNATPFHPPEINKWRQVLKQYYKHEFAYEYLRSGASGENLTNPIFMSLVYFQALKHQVAGKIQARGAFGQIRPLTHLPPKGRANGGGLKFGEMERDSVITHGASSFLRERLMKVADSYQAVFCITCKAFAVNEVSGGYQRCSQCGGTSFGKAVFPYIYKLLGHLLLGYGINLRMDLATPEQLVARLSQPTPLDDDLTGLDRQLLKIDDNRKEILHDEATIREKQSIGSVEYITTVNAGEF